MSIPSLPKNMLLHLNTRVLLLLLPLAFTKRSPFPTNDCDRQRSPISFVRYERKTSRRRGILRSHTSRGPPTAFVFVVVVWPQCGCYSAFSGAPHVPIRHSDNSLPLAILRSVASAHEGFHSILVGMAAGLRLFLTLPLTPAYNTRINGLVTVKQKQVCVVRAATAPGQGGGVMDRPTLDKPTPGRESEFDLKRKKKTSPPYRVMLHNDNFNKREYVVQVLMKSIPGMTVDIAVNVMNEAHINGLAVVIVCPQEDAEDYCMQLRTNGLLSSIEPDSC